MTCFLDGSRPPRQNRALLGLANAMLLVLLTSPSCNLNPQGEIPGAEEGREPQSNVEGPGVDDLFEDEPDIGEPASNAPDVIDQDDTSPAIDEGFTDSTVGSTDAEAEVPGQDISDPLTERTDEGVLEPEPEPEDPFSDAGVVLETDGGLALDAGVDAGLPDGGMLDAEGPVGSDASL